MRNDDPTERGRVDFALRQIRQKGIISASGHEGPLHGSFVGARCNLEHEAIIISKAAPEARGEVRRFCES